MMTFDGGGVEPRLRDILEGTVVHMEKKRDGVSLGDLKMQVGATKFKLNARKVDKNVCDNSGCNS